MEKLLVNEVSKSYPTRGEPLKVLRDVSLEMQPGQNAAILGPSGSGKSTLLHLIGTLDAPTSGTIHFGETDPFTLSEPELAEFRNQNIGFIFQDHHLLPPLTVLENVLVPTLAKHTPGPEWLDRARYLIEAVGLADRMDHRPSELSGGERQRVAVARALIRGPRLLLADEPTGSLDHSTAMTVGQLLLDMQQNEKAMLLVVTHSLKLATLLERRWELAQGELQSPSAS